MNLYKIMFFNSMIMGTLIAISSYSWFSMWMGLEINLLSIIPIINSNKNMFSSESSLKYFITQAMASMILLFSVIFMLLKSEFISPLMNSNFMMMLNSALLMKLGAAPFHFWFPEVMEGLSWMNCMIMLTWQKIAPMILIMNNYINFKFMTLIIMFSLIISTIMNFNQTSLRKILTYSSINHISWMIASMMISFSVWLIYLLIYMLITINIVILFSITKSFFLKQILNFMNNNKMLKFTLMLNFLSLGGLPPFIGFLPKWLTVNYLINFNEYFIALILILFTLIMLFIYIRMIFLTLLFSMNETKIQFNLTKSIIFYSINMISTLSLIFCTFLMNLF